MSRRKPQTSSRPQAVFRVGTPRPPKLLSVGIGQGGLMRSCIIMVALIGLALGGCSNSNSPYCVINCGMTPEQRQQADDRHEQLVRAQRAAAAAAAKAKAEREAEDWAQYELKRREACAKESEPKPIPPGHRLIYITYSGCPKPISQVVPIGYSNPFAPNVLGGTTHTTTTKRVPASDRELRF